MNRIKYKGAIYVAAGGMGGPKLNWQKKQAPKAKAKSLHKGKKTPPSSWKGYKYHKSVEAVFGLTGDKLKKRLQIMFAEAIKGNKSLIKDHHYFEALSKVFDPYGKTGLHILAENGDEGILKHPDVATLKDAHGDTPLFLLAQTENLSEKGAHALLKVPSASTLRNKKGDTLLHAMLRGYSKYKAVALDHKDAGKVKNNHGETPYFLAAQLFADDNTQYEELALDLLRHEEAGIPGPKKLTPVHVIAKNDEFGHLNEAVLKFPGVFDLKDNQGKTPIHYIAEVVARGEADDPSVAKTILKHKEAFTSADNNGATPALLLSESGDVELLTLLLKSPESDELKDKKGRTFAYQLALKVEDDPYEYDNLIDPILKSKNAAEAGPDGRTPLHILAETDFEYNDNVLKLMKHPAFGKVADKKGRTPLHYIADNIANYGDSDDLAKAILKLDDAYTVQDGNGNTPAHLIAHNAADNYYGDEELEDSDIIQLLDKNPLAKKVPNKKGQTPYQIAFNAQFSFMKKLSPEDREKVEKVLKQFGVTEIKTYARALNGWYGSSNDHDAKTMYKFREFAATGMDLKPRTGLYRGLSASHGSKLWKLFKAQKKGKPFFLTSKKFASSYATKIDAAEEFGDWVVKIVDAKGVELLAAPPEHTKPWMNNLLDKMGIDDYYRDEEHEFVVKGSKIKVVLVKTPSDSSDEY